MVESQLDLSTSGARFCCVKGRNDLGVVYQNLAYSDLASSRRGEWDFGSYSTEEGEYRQLLKGEVMPERPV